MLDVARSLQDCSYLALSALIMMIAHSIFALSVINMANIAIGTRNYVLLETKRSDALNEKKAAKKKLKTEEEKKKMVPCPLIIPVQNYVWSN